MPQQSRTVPSTRKPVIPNPGFLERVFGVEPFTPEQEEGIKIAKKEMPNMAPVKPYGFLSRMASPSANAYVTGGSNIYLSGRRTAGQTPQEVADVLTHEQEHIKQKSGSNPVSNFIQAIFRQPQEEYHRRPEEMAAYQAEKDRQDRMGRQRTYMPSFTTGEFLAARDTNLPAKKK